MEKYTLKADYETFLILRGELVTLCWADILFDKHKIHVKQGKGKKDRPVMLPYSIVAGLQVYRCLANSDHYVFEGQYKGEPYSAGSVRQIMKRAVAAAGLEKKATPHTFGTLPFARHTSQHFEKFKEPRFADKPPCNIHINLKTRITKKFI